VDEAPELSPKDAELMRASLARWRAAGRCPAFLRREVIHEAAHAVIAEGLGGHEVVFVTLEYWHPFTRVKALRYGSGVERRRVVYALAGQAAEVVAGWSRADWRRMSRGECDGTSDRERALAAARSICWQDKGLSEMMDELWRDTLRLVRLNWRAVQRVADALLDRGTLQGDEVRAIIERRNP
jgi:hypothetical protein